MTEAEKARVEKLLKDPTAYIVNARRYLSREDQHSIAQKLISLPTDEEIEKEAKQFMLMQMQGEEHNYDYEYDEVIVLLAKFVKQKLL